MGRHAQPESYRFSRSSSLDENDEADAMQNRAYATSQVTDLTAKLKSAAQTLGETRSTSALKLKSEMPGKGQTAAVDNNGEKGNQQAEYAGVEEQETSLSKVARDR